MLHMVCLGLRGLKVFNFVQKSVIVSHGQGLRFSKLRS